MKKIILLMLLFSLLLSGCGVGGQPEETADGSTPDTTRLQQQETDATESRETDTFSDVTEPQKETVPPEVLKPALAVADLKTASYDYPDYSNRQYRLTEVGTFKDRSDFVFGDTLYQKSGQKYYLVSHIGQHKLTKAYDDLEYYGNGIAAAFTKVEGTAPRCELVNLETGEILFQDENAAWVKPISDRYYYVVFTTGRTTNQDSCLLYVPSSSVTYGSPSEGDIMFKGYVQVYDVVKQCYVEKLYFEKPYAVFLCGTTLCVGYDESSSILELHFENGISQKIEKTFGGSSLYAAGDLLLEWNTSEQTVTVNDCNMFPLVTYEKAALIKGLQYDSQYSDRYLAFYGEDGCVGVMDMRGNVVLPAEYYKIENTSNNYFVVQKTKDSESEGLLASDGTQVLPFQYASAHIDVLECPDDMLCFAATDRLFLPGFKTVAYNGYRIGYWGLVCEKSGENGSVLILAENSALSLSYPQGLGGLLAYESVNKNAIYEVLHGQCLYNKEFDFVQATDEYIYILTDDVWTCYKLEY